MFIEVFRDCIRVLFVFVYVSVWWVVGVVNVMFVFVCVVCMCFLIVVV